MTHERPELFPATTQDQLKREYFEERMNALRDEICHPLAGIYTDEDWAEFKEVYGLFSVAVMLAAGPKNNALAS